MSESDLSKKVAELLAEHIYSLDKMIDQWPDGEARRALEQAKAAMEEQLTRSESALVASKKG